ncbi:MAG: hypothetical protein ACM34K_12545 [Bacillota bacterium]
MSLSKISSLSGKTVLEVGSGWTLSHSIVFYLLGADKVFSTDIKPIAVPATLYQAVNNSVISFVRDILTPYEEHHILRKRLDKLQSIKKFDRSALNDLGIEYIAPIDFSKRRLNVPVDLIYSNSVLELIPAEEIPFVLNNLTADLKENGIMINCIHLEDHKDIKSNPFEFYSIATDKYPKILHSLRGNRLRKSTWEELFNSIDGTRSAFIYKWKREDKNLPADIDPSIIFKDEDDLRTSHIGILTRKC